MEKFTKVIAGYFMWVLVAGFLMTGCTPAHYTHLRKVRVEEPETVIAGKTEKKMIREEQAVIAAVTEEITPAEEPVIVEEPEILVADNSAGLPVVSDLKKSSAAVSSIKKAGISAGHKKVSALTIAGKTRVAKAVKAAAVVKQKTGAEDYDTTVRRGLMWSLVAAVIMVWLVGVLFTNAGGLVHVLLAVALVLIVLNLLG